MRECLLNFVQDLLKFPWTREEFLRCNSFRESYDTFHDRIGDCSFDEYVEFFKEFNLECSTLEKSIDKLSDEQLEQVSGGGIGRFIAIPMVALTLLSGVSSVTGFAASIKAPVAVSAQANIQDEWAKTRDFVARAGDPWLSMLPVEGEEGFKEYTKPEVEVDENGEKVVLGKVQENGSRENVYSQIYEIVQRLIKDADDDKSNLHKDLKRAKYIYEWVAKNIKYDDKLCDRIKPQNYDPSVPENSEYDATYRAMPGVVFERKDGVCAGFARLARLMMRMAKIPCAYVGSPKDESEGDSHAFNAVYVEKTHEDGTSEKGWTLMDATWGMQKNENTELDKRMLHGYFPAAYNNKSLIEDNRSVMQETYHQVKRIDENYENSYILNGVKYTVGNDGILVTSDLNDPVSLQIPPEILALGRKIEIGEGIKKYKCSGDEEIDIGSAYDLKEINTDNSRRYKIKGSVLRDIYNGKMEILPIEGVNYTLKDSYIYVSANPENPVSLKIPQEILDLGLRIVIGYGVKEYIYTDDEEIDISEAWNLQSIKTPENGKYKFKDYILYENEKAIGILPKIGEVYYSLSDSTVTFSMDEGGYTMFYPPKTILLALNRKVKIGPGICFYKSDNENEEVDISDATNLWMVKIPQGGRYSKFEDGILYEKNQATGEEKAVGILPLGGFHYSLSGDSINVSKDTKYTGGTFDLKIPQSILALKRKIVIGEGIKKYECSGDEEIDISGAKDLQSITNLPERYSKFESGVLYKKDGSIADLKPGASVDIGGVTYRRQSKDAIKMFSEHEIPDFITPPPGILALNSRIVIGEKITKYKCSQNEEIDIIDAENLIAIDAGASEKYSKFEDGVLYYKEGYKDDEKVAYLAPGRHVNINKVDYSRDADYSIQISSTDLKTGPTQIPKSILDQRQKEDKKSRLVPFGDEYLEKEVPKVKIRNGIEHYVCSGNEKIDISEARDLKFIDTSRSERYIFSDNILYEKCSYGSKKAVAVLPRIGEFNYILREDGSVYVSPASKNSNDLEIPESILRLHRRIVLGPGIKEYKCSGDEEIDISEDINLESIDAYDSDVYDSLKEGVLYKKDGSVADLKPGASVVVDRVKYYRDQKDFHSITVSAAGHGSSVTLTNTPKILDLGHKIVIGEGIEAYKCYGSEEIDISGAYNLQFIDLTISSVYSDFSKGVLYKKDMSVADLIPGSSVVIGEFEYCREYSDCHSIYVSGNPNNFTTLTPPPEILNLNCKIKIGRGIREYKCSCDEEIDISDAIDIFNINTEYSRISDAANATRKYTFEVGGVLYENDGNGNKKTVGILPRRGDFYYSLREDGSIYISADLIGTLSRRRDFYYSRREDGSLYISSGPNSLVTLKIPPGILALKRKIVIGEGIEEYQCSGNEEIDISGAKDLQSITGYSERYDKFEDGKLYNKQGQVVGEQL